MDGIILITWVWEECLKADQMFDYVKHLQMLLLWRGGG